MEVSRMDLPSPRESDHERHVVQVILSVFSLLAGRTGSRGTGIRAPIPYQFTTERTYARRYRLDVGRVASLAMLQ